MTAITTQTIIINLGRREASFDLVAREEGLMTFVEIKINSRHPMPRTMLDMGREGAKPDPSYALPHNVRGRVSCHRMQKTRKHSSSVISQP